MLKNAWTTKTANGLTGNNKEAMAIKKGGRMVESNREWLRDPVKCENGKWYFSEENWSFRHGPYANEAMAREAFREYCKNCLPEDKEGP